MEHQQSSEDPADNGGDLVDVEHDQKRRPRATQACDQCRQRKLRCDVVQEPFQSCSLCKRLNLECKTGFSAKSIGKQPNEAKAATKTEHLRRNTSRAQMQDHVLDEKNKAQLPLTHAMLHAHTHKTSLPDELRGAGTCSGSAASSEPSRLCVVRKEPSIEPPWDDEVPRRPFLLHRQDPRDEVVSTPRLPSWTSLRLLDLPHLAREQKFEVRNQSLYRWLSQGSEDLTLESDEPRPVLESQYPLDDIPHWILTSNRRQPGRIYFSGDEGHLKEVDRNTLASNRKWVDEPMHLAIKSGEPSLPITSADAMHQYQQMCSQTEAGHDAQNVTPLPSWLQSFERIHLELKNGKGSQQNQPESSQQAIEQYFRHSKGLSVVSEAATLGTYMSGDRRRSRLEGGAGDSLGEAGQQEASWTSRDRFRADIQQMVSKDKDKGQVDAQAQDSGSDSSAGPFFVSNVDDLSLDDQGQVPSPFDGNFPVPYRPPRLLNSNLMSNYMPDPFIGKTLPNKGARQEIQEPKESPPSLRLRSKYPPQPVTSDYELPKLMFKDTPDMFAGKTLPDQGQNRPWASANVSLPALSSHIGLPAIRQHADRIESFRRAELWASPKGNSARNEERETHENESIEEPMTMPSISIYHKSNPESDTRSESHTNNRTDYLLGRYDPSLSVNSKKQALAPLRHSTIAGTIMQTDSGYASLRKTVDEKRGLDTDPQRADVEQTTIIPEFDDAATEYTNADSVGTWKRESYILDFAEDLFEKILDLQPDPEDVERISELLPDLLKAFALKLGFQAPMPVYRDVMYFVHKYRSVIATAFKDRALREEEHPVDVSSTSAARMPLGDFMSYQQDLGEAEVPPVQDEKMPLSDLMTSWFQRQNSEPYQRLEPANNDIADLSAVADNLEHRETTPTSSAKSEETAEDQNASDMGYRALVLGTDAFNWLLTRLRLEMRLVATEPKAMEAIGSKIVSSLRSPGKFSRKTPSQNLKAIFELDWDVRNFFQQQKYNIKASEALPRVVTLTGSDKDVQALTCAEYLSQTWPLTGAKMMELIQIVLDSEDDALSTCEFSDGTKLSAWTCGQEFVAEAQGNAFALAEVGEQVAWLATALRLSSVEGAIACCYPVITEVRMTDIPRAHASFPTGRYRFGFEFDTVESSIVHSSGQCWHNMFNNAVVVKGYPILSRAEAGTGMEVSLNVMAGLARADRLDQFGGATLIKGFSSLLIPMKKSEDSIIWHLIYNSDGSRISYLNKILSHVGPVTTLDVGNFRHILGWCAEAQFYAGSAQANYIVGASGLTRPREDGALAGLFVSPGRGIVGGSAFVLGEKDTPAHVARNGYIPKLQWISTKFILLWDETDRRGWLINGTTALLHVVRSSLAHNSADKFKAAFMFEPQDLEEPRIPGTADSAVDVLINPANLALKLYQEKDGHLLLQSRIDHYYNILEKLIDHQADIAGEDGSKLADYPRKHLEGWDFRDLATSRDPLYPRVTTLSTEGKSWVDLTRALHAVTLFGRGFGELIRPGGANTCEFWADLPKGKSYIAAALSDLLQVTYNNNYCNDGHVRLSQGIIWHTPTAIFGSCRCRGTLRNNHCEPVQSVLPSSMLDVLLPRKQLIPEESCGAVIFGQHSSLPWHWKDHGPPQEEDSLTSAKVSETSSTLDSGIGTSNVSSFDVDATTGTSRSGTPGSRQLSSRNTGTGSSQAVSVAHDSYTAVEYTVGILCALPKELLAVRALFDRKHEGLEPIAGDVNHYCLGQIGNHMVVAACLPKGDYGTNPAAESASNMKRSFPGIDFCLLVGIGGGVPSKEYDIRLGDVVISAPTGPYPGVIQHDRGKDNENRNFERTGSLRPPPGFLMTAISRLESNPDRPSNPLEPYLNRIQDRIRFPERVKYQHPGQEHDTFSQAECQTCQSEGKCFERNLFLKQRSKRPNNDPEIFYGLIASGNKVIKDAHVRNEWADNCGVLCFEMEAAGIMNTFPCLVIRGICDYADSSKNKVWQEYAAATAAAYAKLLLEELGACAFSGGKGIALTKRTRSFAGDELPGKRHKF